MAHFGSKNNYSIVILVYITTSGKSEDAAGEHHPLPMARVGLQPDGCGILEKEGKW